MDDDEDIYPNPDDLIDYGDNTNEKENNFEEVEEVLTIDLINISQEEKTTPMAFRQVRFPLNIITSPIEISLTNSNLILIMVQFIFGQSCTILALKTIRH